MTASTSRIRSALPWFAATIGAAAAAYAIHVRIAWSHYERMCSPSQEDEDSLLDLFMPGYEVAEHHHIRVAAPAAVTLAAARNLDLFQRPLVRAIFRTRELILGASVDNRPRTRGLLAEVQSLGWVVLDEILDREVVVGAAAKPWKANVRFRSIQANEFTAFHEPDYVKIVWTLRADPLDESASIFRTETRVVPTDPVARAKFRRYWSFLSPGISLIRWASLKPLRTEAERRARMAGRRVLVG